LDESKQDPFLQLTDLGVGLQSSRAGLILVHGVLGHKDLALDRRGHRGRLWGRKSRSDGSPTTITTATTIARSTTTITAAIVTSSSSTTTTSTVQPVTTATTLHNIVDNVLLVIVVDDIICP